MASYFTQRHGAQSVLAWFPDAPDCKCYFFAQRHRLHASGCPPGHLRGTSHFLWWLCSIAERQCQDREMIHLPLLPTVISIAVRVLGPRLMSNARREHLTTCAKFKQNKVRCLHSVISTAGKNKRATKGNESEVFFIRLSSVGDPPQTGLFSSLTDPWNFLT